MRRGPACASPPAGPSGSARRCRRSRRPANFSRVVDHDHHRRWPRPGRPRRRRARLAPSGYRGRCPGSAAVHVSSTRRPPPRYRARRARDVGGIEQVDGLADEKAQGAAGQIASVRPQAARMSPRRVFSRPPVLAAHVEDAGPEPDGEVGGRPAAPPRSRGRGRARAGIFPRAACPRSRGRRPREERLDDPARQRGLLPRIGRIVGASTSARREVGGERRHGVALPQSRARRPVTRVVLEVQPRVSRALGSPAAGGSRDASAAC